MDIHIKTADGAVQYPNADHWHLDESNGVLLLVVSGDTIRFSPHYWHQFVVDPKADDPLDLR
ncbi:hypothetical protein [Mycobacteroides abscessus]|uniref:hypothetical protein n=1 Tax=Mycobacteroides abscessus TaxID=36809 RepID=UPI000258563C|nr:hypothetical protein [Mycobacteroides abscessus]EIC63009.1 hypothetical protein OUW_17536 [Mycobacteroides abscessus M93]